jgi:hypothetical protein
MEYSWFNVSKTTGGRLGVKTESDDILLDMVSSVFTYIFLQACKDNILCNILKGTLLNALLIMNKSINVNYASWTVLSHVL